MRSLTCFAGPPRLLPSWPQWVLGIGALGLALVVCFCLDNYSTCISIALFTAFVRRGRSRSLVFWTFCRHAFFLADLANAKSWQVCARYTCSRQAAFAYVDAGFLATSRWKVFESQDVGAFSAHNAPTASSNRVRQSEIMNSVYLLSESGS